MKILNIKFEIYGYATDKICWEMFTINCIYETVVKTIVNGYNIINLKCWISCYFEPTFTLNGIPILCNGCQASISQRKAEVTLRSPTWRELGVKVQEPAFWDTYEEAANGCFFIFIGILLHITEVYMKSIKKNNNSFWMIGCFLIILLLFLLLISKTPMKVTEETIDFDEVVALIEALEDDSENSDDYMNLLMKYKKEEKQETTYEMLEETLNILEPAGVISGQILDNVSRDKVIDRNEFFSIYEQLIDAFDKRSEIALEEVKIIGIAEEADEDKYSILVTERENGNCREELFSEYVGYATNTYVKRDEQSIQYLAVKDFHDEKISMSYIYVAGQDAEGLHFRVNGVEVVLPYKDSVKVQNDTVASLTIQAGQVIKADSFSEKINDKVLSINDTSVRLENYGTYELHEDMKIYKVFDGLSEGTIADVALGYEFVDFVLDDGKICACLIVAKEEMEYIRVLIKTTDFASNYHENVTISCDSTYKVYKNGEEISQCGAMEESTFSEADMKTDEIIKIVPDVLSGKVTLFSISRNQGTPDYGGVLELHKKEEGIVVINEVLLEEYLYTVVPSEMPSYYHEQALMAQAVCARTYAYTKMQNAGLKSLGAHLDDSTSFQVYNNIDEQVSTTNAVRQTMGQIVSKDGQPLETMYYSTSFGIGTTGLRLNKEEKEIIDLSTNTVFDEYISLTYASDFEAEEGFYRWQYETELDTELLEKRIKECYTKNNNNVLVLNDEGQFAVRKEYQALGEIEDIFVSERSVGGRAEKLIVRGSKNTMVVCGEYQIRYILLNEEKTVEKQDGTKVDMSTLLPSAFFKIETGKNGGSVIGYSIVGGGYGHGNGMSQNGAGNMAKEGYSYTDILTLFYENCTLEQIY